MNWTVIGLELNTSMPRSEQPRVIIVTSGGMLTQKLAIDDLQSANMKPFDGTMVYAQNKRQQVLIGIRSFCYIGMERRECKDRIYGKILSLRCH